MQPLSRTIDDRSSAATYYEANDKRLLHDYEQIRFEEIHSDLLPLILSRKGRALDVGCGSGRDAAWLGKRGWNVVAVDSSLSMLDGARRLHDADNIVWLHDSLPSVAATKAFGGSFDLFLLSAVLMHLQPNEQLFALDNLIALAAPEAIISLSVKNPSESEPWLSDVDLDRVSAWLEERSFVPVSRSSDLDLFGRKEVRWQKLVSRRAAFDPTPIDVGNR